MSVIKRYNPDTSQWELVAIGAQGPQGIQGPTGPTGPTGPAGMYAGDEAPADTSLVWVDTDAPDNLAVLQTEVGVPGGVATLDSDGIVTAAQRWRTGFRKPHDSTQTITQPNFPVAVLASGAVDIRWRMTEHTASTMNWRLSGGAQVFSMRWNGANTLSLGWTEADGVSTRSVSLDSVFTGTKLATTYRFGFRITLELDDGAGNARVRIYSADTADAYTTTWTLRDTGLSAGVSSLYAPATATWVIGANTTPEGGSGTWSHFRVLDGIDGTPVADCPLGGNAPNWWVPAGVSAPDLAVGDISTRRWTVNGSRWSVVEW